jgi:UDP-N-acetylmuramyl pentapeptide phosphotransferase/UDP-N-acetylglucosamine-1-phosphate transferase
MGICTLLTGAITAGVIGACLQPVVVRLLIRGSVLDIPNARSSHTVPTPRGGGIAIVVAIACALMLDGTTRTFVVPLLLFAGVGLLEDLRGASIAVRLSLQCGAGAVAAAVMVLHPSPAWFLLVVFWLVGYANVFNFMDGLNGMSAGHAILAGGIYATVGWIDGVPVLTTIGAVTAVAAATFLPWNAGRARVFPGDVGAYGLGALLAATAAYALTAGVAVEAVVAPLALYLTDAGSTLARRILRAERWYEPHRSHAFQRLTDVGWSHQAVTAVTVGVGALVSAAGLAAERVASPVRLALDGGGILLLTAYMALPGVLARRRAVISLPSAANDAGDTKKARHHEISN